MPASRPQRLLLALHLPLLLLGACGGDAATGPADSGVDGFSARIDGTPWRPQLAVTAQNPLPGLYSITGTRTTGADNYTLSLSLHGIRGPGTYPLGVTPLVSGGSAVLSQPPASGWNTPITGTAGEITITSVGERVVGTFSFTAVPQGATPGSRVVTEGRIDVPVSGTGGVAAANQGSSVTGTIGGAFIASSATSVVVGSGATQALTITATNTVRTLTISIGAMTGPGTYALAGGTPARTVQVSGAPGTPQATWGSQAAGGSGTVTVTALTAARITGSFTATLAPLAGGASGTLTVSGTFDMGRS
jgi:hypothetical protein